MYFQFYVWWPLFFLFYMGDKGRNVMTYDITKCEHSDVYIDSIGVDETDNEIHYNFTPGIKNVVFNKDDAIALAKHFGLLDDI